MVVAEAVDDENANGSHSYDLELDIDDTLPLTDYPWCEFIEMGYFVHVVARTHSFYDDVVVKLPVIVKSKVGLIDFLLRDICNDFQIRNPF